MPKTEKSLPVLILDVPRIPIEVLENFQKENHLSLKHQNPALRINGQAAFSLKDISKIKLQ